MGRAPGKIGGIGQADLKFAGPEGHGPQVRAYTGKPGIQAVARDVAQGGGVGRLRKLDAGDGTA